MGKTVRVALIVAAAAMVSSLAAKEAFAQG
jgi:hypothetical protein